MTREQIIKGLECCYLKASCAKFPYDGYPRCVTSVAADAIAMLKEQEEQYVLNIGQQISCKSGSCPKCGKMLNTTCNKRYCGDCGQAVKWE